MKETPVPSQQLNLVEAFVKGLLAWRVQPLVGENFCSYLCRRVNDRALTMVSRKLMQRELLKHFRGAGMDVNASAVGCLAILRMHSLGVAQ